MPMKDLTGQRFGMLTVLQREGTKNGHVTWLCECDCGNMSIVRGSDLHSGKAATCGCRKKAGLHRTHELTGTRLYRIWRNVKTRCENESFKQYKDYGGRGIAICQEWKADFESFHKWAISNGYADNLTLDRIDVNGNYEPSNCRWVSMKEQSRNRTDNYCLTYNGETKILADWAEITGINRETIKSRIEAGKTVEEALTKAP
jgi:hypothetical protein